MRVLSLQMLAVVLIGAVIPAVAEKPDSSSASACAGCHRSEAETQPRTPMGRAMFFPAANNRLKANSKWRLQKGAYTYTVERQGDNAKYSVSDGTRTIALPIHWNFGDGVQAWIMERDGHYYESLVSYYPETSKLDTTIGDESLAPHTLDEAVGRPLSVGDLKDCLGCHATNAVSEGKLNLKSFQPGVTCEHCHVGASAHLFDAFNGEFSSAPPDLSKLSSEDVSGFCGQCHRTWETVIRNHWRGPANVRFAPYRLANSKCFDGADPRISCLACHNPHQDVVRDVSFYDSKCLACHKSATPAATNAATAPACPVAAAQCVSCHMPKVSLPDEHVTFTDHQIRIVKAGEPYPD